MDKYDILHKLKKISSVANDILYSDYDDEKKYDMIFSNKISQQVYDLFRESPIYFSYNDPDASYYEDARAFVRALDSHIIDLENYDSDSLNSEDNSNDELYQRFRSL